jgi:NAD(P)-dependent dehydrogenase (short-subunit alcohol dehydrogenase family)
MRTTTNSYIKINSKNDLHASGPVSILVNNAGVSVTGTLETYDPVAMERMRRINVDGVIHTIRAGAAGMRQRGYGRIINIASNAAIGTALPGSTFYAATKAEVLILTRRFAMELGRSGITVNAVAPGWIVTDMSRAGCSNQEFEARVRMVSERAMVGRTGQPDDLANAVAFLAAPESGFVTAQVITVDAGSTISGTDRNDVMPWGRCLYLRAEADERGSEDCDHRVEMTGVTWRRGLFTRKGEFASASG